MGLGDANDTLSFAPLLPLGHLLLCLVLYTVYAGAQPAAELTAHSSVLIILRPRPGCRCGCRRCRSQAACESHAATHGHLDPAACGKGAMPTLGKQRTPSLASSLARACTPYSRDCAAGLRAMAGLRRVSQAGPSCTWRWQQQQKG